jgi:hypothetical protein
MHTGKLPERDGPSLLRDRVQSALQDLGGKTVTQALQEQVTFGDHVFHLTSYANPTTLRVDYGVRCRKCGWHFHTSKELLFNASKEADRATLQASFYKLLKRFCEEVDPDCKTASIMAVVTAVHDR